MSKNKMEACRGIKETDEKRKAFIKLRFKILWKKVD